MKLRNWNEWDMAPAETRFVKNEIELSERRMKKIWESGKRKAKKDAAMFFSVSMATSLAGIIVLIRQERLLRLFCRQAGFEDRKTEHR